MKILKKKKIKKILKKKNVFFSIFNVYWEADSPEFENLPDFWNGRDVR